MDDVVVNQTQNDGQNKPINYASCSLTPTERKYSFIMRGALGCVWTVEQFRTYLSRGMFTLQTDHKPLIYMLNPEKATLLPPQMQRLSMMKISFEFTSYPFTYSLKATVSSK